MAASADTGCGILARVQIGWIQLRPMFSPARSIVALLLTAFIWHGGTGTAAEPRPQKPAAYTDPASAGPDFLLQGEYEGEGCGAQVIALGNRKFRFVGW